MNKRKGKPANYIKIIGDVAYITLTKGKVALISVVDVEEAGKYLWYFSGHYAVRNAGKFPNQRAQFLHREILNAPSGMEVDHINGDKLDNRRSNLRVCSKIENQRNQKPRTTLRGQTLSSRFKGVHLPQQGNKYKAQIQVAGQKIYLGAFDSEIEAAKAYDSAARQRFGDFALTNFEVQ
jgi:hypothetical protein